MKMRYLSSEHQSLLMSSLDDYYSESEDDDLDGKEPLRRIDSAGSFASIGSETSTPERGTMSSNAL